jgi:hypothetical protein
LQLKSNASFHQQHPINMLCCSFIGCNIYTKAYLGQEFTLHYSSQCHIPEHKDSVLHLWHYTHKGSEEKRNIHNKIKVHKILQWTIFYSNWNTCPASLACWSQAGNVTPY